MMTSIKFQQEKNRNSSRENNVTSRDVHNHGLKTKHQVHLLLDTLYFILHCKVDHFFE